MKKILKQITQLYLSAFLLGASISPHVSATENNTKRNYEVVDSNGRSIELSSLKDLEKVIEETKTLPTKHYNDIIFETSEKYGIDPLKIYTICMIESSFRPRVISKKGAVGLMQIMPGTGRGRCNLKRNELFNPHNNIDCGTKYLLDMINTFEGLGMGEYSENLAVIGYNRGDVYVKNYIEKHIKKGESKVSNPKQVYDSILKTLPKQTQNYLEEYKNKTSTQIES